MNLFISLEYDTEFINELIAKFIDDVKLKLLKTNFDVLDLWLQVEYGFNEVISCKDIIQQALKHIEIVTTTSNYIIQFNPIVYYPGTTTRLITLLKTITYGTRHFRGNSLLIDEFKQLNMNLDNLYDQYRLLGVVL